jgi:hypothetical protein
VETNFLQEGVTMTNEEKSRIAYDATSSFGNVKYVPTGYVSHAIDLAAHRIGVVPSDEEKEEINIRVKSALRVLFDAPLRVDL